MTDEPIESKHHRLMHTNPDHIFTISQYLSDTRTISFIAGAIIGFVAGCLVTLIIAIELASLV